ncbi:MAG: putative bifunctional diguanylate cyclase/phosphodiesterase [Bordetella sp.]|uniref:putative bifunctional diguanylate cyclase/phosphodiesterase n=1 Tax=Bordetella sp. TaxID=28081 RepID=UPI003F7C991A
MAFLLLFIVSDRQLRSRMGLTVRSLAKANREIDRLAQHDALTQLPNRGTFNDLLDQTLAGETHGRPERFGLLLMDCDGLETINEAYGYAVGDQLLIEVARRVREIVPMPEVVARTRGDEFIMMVGADGVEDVFRLASRLTAGLAKPFRLADYQLQITSSIGIAMYPEHGQTREALVANAEAALNHAKDQGHDTYSLFEESMTAAVQEQAQLLADMRQAFDRKEFTLYYQPKFDAPSGPVSGVEALMRWIHPERGVVPPDKFIPLMEKLGLVVPIGNWALDEACRQMALWHRMGHTDWTVAVNISALQFNHADLIRTVGEALTRHALPAQSLMLEVTETIAMRDTQASTRVLQQLHEMGVGISIDDFGTGYSSLLYLKRLPASELKIDQGFIRDLDCDAEDSEDAAIVRAIIALGRALDLRVVAEGVETHAQQEFLTRIGCNALQGFLLAHPMPADQLLNTLAVSA